MALVLGFQVQNLKSKSPITVKLTPPTMRIEPHKDTLEVFLELPPDYDSNRNYRTSVVEYIVSYWTPWSKENKTVGLKINYM